MTTETSVANMSEFLFIGLLCVPLFLLLASVFVTRRAKAQRTLLRRTRWKIQGSLLSSLSFFLMGQLPLVTGSVKDHWTAVFAAVACVVVGGLGLACQYRDHSRWRALAIRRRRGRQDSAST